MSTSRLVCVVVSIAFIQTLGCRDANRTNPDSQPSAGARAISPAATQPEVAQRPSAPSQEETVAPGTAQALARRAASYAESVEPMVKKRQARAQADAGEWPDPDAMHLTSRDSDAAPAQTSGGAAAGHAEQSAPNIGATAAAEPNKKQVRARPEAEQATVEGSVMPAPPADGSARKFAQRVKDYPQDLSAHVDDELSRFLREEPVPDVQAMASLTAEDRELLSALMDSLTNFRSALRSDNNMLFSRKIRPLIELSDRLRGQAELAVPTLALCTWARGYGLYDPLEPARFVAGKEHKVVVYCEVENFQSQPNDKKQYETHLTQDVVLYTESSGLEVWKDKRQSYIDQSRARRHDFFIGRVISLPANLTIGTYLLKVTIEDTQAKHIAENTVPIEIVAQ